MHYKQNVYHAIVRKEYHKIFYGKKFFLIETFQISILCTNNFKIN